MADPFFAEVVRQGWKLERSVDSTALAGASLLGLPQDLRQFLASFSTLTNASETLWLNSAQDFGAEVGDGFSWNEFELISLAAAEGEPALEQEIKGFWSNHIPVLMSVDGSYEFVAYCQVGENSGMYVQGSEPEFEQVHVIARSLAEFKSLILSKSTEKVGEDTTRD